MKINLNLVTRFLHKKLIPQGHSELMSEYDKLKLNGLLRDHPPGLVISYSVENIPWARSGKTAS